MILNKIIGQVVKLLPKSPVQIETGTSQRTRDLAIVVIIVGVFSLAAFIYDFYDHFSRRLQENEHWEMDELVLVAFVLSLSLAWLAYRRWRELEKEVSLRKQLEAGLSESEARYRSVVDNIKEVIFQTDAAGLWTFLNPAWTEITGFTLAESLGQNFLDFIHPDDRQRNMALFQPLIERKKDYCHHQIRYLTKTGSAAAAAGDGFRWLEVHARLTLDAEDNIIGTSGTLRDVTELKRAEAELRQAQVELERRVEERTADLLETNKHLRQEIVKREEAEESIRRRNRQLAMLNQIITASVDDTSLEVVLETACRELALVLDLPQTCLVLFNDEKTEAKIAAEYVGDEEAQPLQATFPIAEGFPFQELFGDKKPLIIEDAHRDPRLAMVRELVHRRGTVSALVLPLLVGEELNGTLNVKATKRRTFSTEEINLAWSVADQLSGLLARSRLGQARQLLNTVIEQSAESVMITDPAGRIIYVNPAFEQISGYSQAEVIGQNVHALPNGLQELAWDEEIFAALRAGEVWQGRFSNERQDGTPYSEDVLIGPVRDEKDAIVNYVAIKRDVTREVALEEQYRQAQKMEAIGQLAGGIAHDFNNLLTVINGYSEILLQRSRNGNETWSKYLEEINKAGRRAHALTRQLLAFSRKQMLQPELLDPNQAIADLSKMLRRLITENIELITVLKPDIKSIRADRGQLEQVLINLAVNARDAMPQGGHLVIETANVTLDQAYAQRHSEVTPGEYVMLAVSDNGTGMTAETKARIFEPFFTTKEQGKGTGLGLATSFGIVKQSGGHIKVYSEPGQGTTFKIYLPSVEEQVDTDDQQSQDRPLPRGTETILLVEDAVGLREMTRRILQDRGYTVLEATNGHEALQFVETHPEQAIDLLFTDMVMPQMGGKALADRLIALRPHLRVLFTSGYTDQAVVHQGELEPGLAFLEKPFSLAALTHKIREVLDGVEQLSR